MLPEAAEVVVVVGMIGLEVFVGPSAVPAGLSGLVLGLQVADLGLARAMYIL